jgi:shikimate kinase
MLILFGFKGVGKTYYGKRLADRLKLPFVDTDDLIQKLYGKSMDCKTIYKEIGEMKFRALEKQALHDLSREKSIVALGGGAILDHENCDLLKKKGRLVYLKASEKHLKGLPLPLSASSFDEYYRLRKEIYEKVNGFSVEIDGKKDDEIVNELEGIFHGV